MSHQDTRENILKTIREIIDQVASEELKRMASKKEVMAQEMKKTRAQRVQDAEKALFFGFEEEVDDKNRIQLYEEEMKIQIKDSEIKASQQKLMDNFKRRFGSNTPTIELDKQSDSQRIVSFPKLPDGKEAFLSGKLTFGTGKKVSFSFSVLNGVKIESENFVIDATTKNLTEVLYDVYKQWKDEWSQRISGSQPEQEMI